MELYIFQALTGGLLFGIGAMIFKWIAHVKGDDNLFFVALYASGAACFFADGFEEIGKFGDVNYYVSGLLIGLGAAGGNYCFARGLHHGPTGLSSAFAKANIVLVILISAFYYREPLEFTEIIGILFFLSAMLVVNLKIGGSSKPASKIWFLLMIGAMILLAFRNGGLKVVDELGIVSALVMALAYSICALFFAGRYIMSFNTNLHSEKSSTHILAVGALTGVVSFAGLYFYIAALEKGPASVVVTLFSLDLLFVLLMSYLLFGERLNFNQKIGFLFSAIGFVLLGIS